MRRMPEHTHAPQSLLTGQVAAPPPLHDPVAHLLTLLREAPQRRWLIGIVGLPGAGKSTIAQALADAVNQAMGEPTALALGMDGFHLTRAQLRAFADPEAALARRGAPWTFDPHGLAARLALWRAQPAQPLAWPGFEHGVGDPVPDAIQLAPQVRLVLLEGLYLLHDDHGWDLRGAMDACWFLDVSMAVAMDRLAARHQAAWGITRDEALARLARNDRLNAQIVWASRGRADAVIGDALPAQA
jgi:pantothenate kinase